MADYFTRLAERTLGVVPVAQPIITSMFAPEPVVASPLLGNEIDTIQEAVQVPPAQQAREVFTRSAPRLVPPDDQLSRQNHQISSQDGQRLARQTVQSFQQSVIPDFPHQSQCQVAPLLNRREAEPLQTRPSERPDAAVDVEEEVHRHEPFSSVDTGHTIKPYENKSSMSIAPQDGLFSDLSRKPSPDDSGSSQAVSASREHTQFAEAVFPLKEKEPFRRLDKMHVEESTNAVHAPEPCTEQHVAEHSTSTALFQEEWREQESVQLQNVLITRPGDLLVPCQPLPLPTVLSTRQVTSPQSIPRTLSDASVARDSSNYPHLRISQQNQLAMSQQLGIQPTREGSSPPTIRITIGRIDVRAVTPPAPAVRSQPRPSVPPLSLDDYTKQRNGGGR